MNLEPYRERYTELLTKWTETACARSGVKCITVKGKTLGKGIKTGKVLDAYGRSHYALTQMAELVKLLPTIKSKDVIYFEDMFTPGYEALPYILSQTGVKPIIITRNYAQSVDVYDFTAPMQYWIRHYEHMVANTCHVMLCASTVHKDMMESAGWKTDIRVVGLPFDIDMVRSVYKGNKAEWKRKENKVIYSSRFDAEKQPWFFLDVVEEMWGEAQFIICTGAEELRGNYAAVHKANIMEEEGKLTIYTGCSKEFYYKELCSSKVQFNCAFQDFVSFTMLEASAFGVATVAPCFRSFPEALYGNPNNLYIPWSKKDAISKVRFNLRNRPSEDVYKPAKEHSKTIEKIINIAKELA
jgi:glycosyltransferase involved in cell wall biosynthesis